MSTQLSVSVVTASFSDLAPMDSDQETMRVRFKTQPSVVRPRRRDAHVGIGSVVGASLIDGRCPLRVKSGLSSAPFYDWIAPDSGRAASPLKEVRVLPIGDTRQIRQ